MIDDLSSRRRAGWLLLALGAGVQVVTAFIGIHHEWVTAGMGVWLVILVTGEIFKVFGHSVCRAFWRLGDTSFYVIMCVFTFAGIGISVVGTANSIDAKLGAENAARAKWDQARRQNREELARVGTELASVPAASRDLALIHADIERIVADSRSNRCEVRDGFWSRTECPKVDRWRAEVASADRRSVLEERQRELQRVASEPPPPGRVDNFALGIVALASWLGVGAEHHGVAYKYGIGLLIELTAWLASAAGVRLRHPETRRRVPSGSGTHGGRVPGARGQMGTDGDTPVNTAVRSDSAFEALPQLQKRLIRVVSDNGGHMVLSIREFSEICGCTRKAADIAFRRASENGWLRREVKEGATTLALLRQAPPEKNTGGAKLRVVP